MPDKRIKLSQVGLIDRIIEATGMLNCNPNKTPCAVRPLGTDTDGAPFSEDWSYRSVVGQLSYLGRNSRPEIEYAIHRCARFNHCPRASHAEAIKTICRYLKGTRTDGLIFTPGKEIAVDCHVDADFAGLWNVEDRQDPVCVKSRTGFVLSFADCPLLWASKLQTMVAMSIQESEYLAMSESMRSLIPIRYMVDVVYAALKVGNGTIPVRTSSVVFEDNNGCIAMASSPKMNARTKHLAVHYHFFRERVLSGAIKLVKIDTKEQKADIFTKGLGVKQFLYLRGILCGW